MMKTVTKERQKRADINFRVLEEAHEAITKLRTLRPFLSDSDKETIALLIDKEIMDHLEKSIKEADAEKYEPLDNILK